MDEFLKGLFTLLIELEIVNIKDNSMSTLVFSAGCSIIGALTVIADLSFFVIKNESPLLLKHSFKNTSVFLFAWAFGAAFFGYIGQMLNIFQVSLMACATVGIAWPIIFTKLLSKLRENQEFQTPTSEV